VPSDFDPILSRHQRNLVIQIQYHHGHTPTGGAPHHLRAIITPEKMAVPLLFPRVEEPRSSSGHRVVTARLSTFGIIAKPAGKPQILFALCPTSPVVFGTILGRENTAAPLDTLPISRYAVEKSDRYSGRSVGGYSG
jgi:hypothetical protein